MYARMVEEEEVEENEQEEICSIARFFFCVPICYGCLLMQKENKST